MTNNDLEVTVKSRNRLYYKGNAKTLTAVNNLGPFDILPMHANFISLIKDYIIIDKGSPEEKNIKVKSGLLHNNSNKVIVYLDI